jgi:hypothetical protein
MTAPDTLADDILIGAAALAHFLFGSDEERLRRRVYYLTHTAKCRLPHFRIGNQLAARRSTLVAWIAAQEARR